MKVSYVSWSRIRKYVKAAIVRGITILRAARHCHNRLLPVENGPDFVFEIILKNFYGYDPIWLLFFCRYCNVCETLICKLVSLFIVFGEHGRYVGNINHLW